MSTGHNRPTNDATDEEWFTYLRGRRFHSDKEPKPVANYVAFRGFWVPPTVLPEGSKVSETVAAPKRRPNTFSKTWFSAKNVQKLAKSHPEAFADLKRYIQSVDEETHAETEKQRAASHRTRLDLSVEAGLMSAEEADKRYEAWEREGRPAAD